VRQPVPSPPPRAAAIPPPAPPPEESTPTAPAPIPEEIAAPRGSSGPPLGLLLIGGVLLFGIVVAVVALAYLRKSTPPPPVAVSTVAPAPTTLAAVRETPVPSAAPVLGVLHVQTQPVGATVTVNGTPRGTSPLDVP